MQQEKDICLKLANSRRVSNIAKMCFAFCCIFKTWAVDAQFDALPNCCVHRKIAANILSEPSQLSVTCNKPARLLLLQCVGALTARFTSHFKPRCYLMIAPDATKQKPPCLKEGGGGKKREEGGWAWWLLSDSQEWFSPSIGVLKAPWIINGLSLRCQPPPRPLLSPRVTPLPFFPFSTSLHSSVSPVPPSPPVCFHPPHLFLIVSLSEFIFAVSLPPFPLIYPPLPHLFFT